MSAPQTLVTLFLCSGCMQPPFQRPTRASHWQIFFAWPRGVFPERVRIQGCQKLCSPSAFYFAHGGCRCRAGQGVGPSSRDRMYQLLHHKHPRGTAEKGPITRVHRPPLTGTLAGVFSRESFFFPPCSPGGQQRAPGNPGSSQPSPLKTFQWPLPHSD